MGYRHKAAERFNKACVSAKIGTQPLLVRLDGRCKIAVGSKIRWREMIGQRWQTGVVTNVDPLRIDRH